MALHRLRDDAGRRGLVAGLAEEGSQQLALVVDGAPEAVHLAIDLHINLVQEPLPVGGLAHGLDPPLTDLGGEHRTDRVPPEPHSLVADVDSPLV